MLWGGRGTPLGEGFLTSVPAPWAPHFPSASDSSRWGLLLPLRLTPPCLPSPSLGQLQMAGSRLRDTRPCCRGGGQRRPSLGRWRHVQPQQGCPHTSFPLHLLPSGCPAPSPWLTSASARKAGSVPDRCGWEGASPWGPGPAGGAAWHLPSGCLEGTAVGRCIPGTRPPVYSSCGFVIACFVDGETGSQRWGVMRSVCTLTVVPGPGAC